MALSEEQTKAVAEWFAAGAGVAEIQKRISEEFGVDMTYLDVRLLVADLPQPAEEEPASETPETPAGPENPEIPETPDNPESPEAPAGGVSVSVDPISPPGAIACGPVVFSDGTSGKWVLDQMGRLGFTGLPAGYRPTPEDGAEFQTQLFSALRAKGLA